MDQVHAYIDVNHGRCETGCMKSQHHTFIIFYTRLYVYDVYDHVCQCKFVGSLNYSVFPSGTYKASIFNKSSWFLRNPKHSHKTVWNVCICWEDVIQGTS